MNRLKSLFISLLIITFAGCSSTRQEYFGVSEKKWDKLSEVERNLAISKYYAKHPASSTSQNIAEKSLKLDDVIAEKDNELEIQKAVKKVLDEMGIAKVEEKPKKDNKLIIQDGSNIAISPPSDQEILDWFN